MTALSCFIDKAREHLFCGQFRWSYQFSVTSVLYWDLRIDTTYSRGERPESPYKWRFVMRNLRKSCLFALSLEDWGYCIPSLSAQANVSASSREKWYKLWRIQIAYTGRALRLIPQEFQKFEQAPIECQLA